MTRTWVLVMACALAVGCSSTDNGRTTRIENRPMTANDTPFGGGVAPSQQPNGDPFGRVGTRNVITVQHGADNGAPETRVGGGTAPDARVK